MKTISCFSGISQALALNNSGFGLVFCACGLCRFHFFDAPEQVSGFGKQAVGFGPVHGG